METKSALLSSNTARNILGTFVNHAEIGHTLNAIDRLGGLHDALRLARDAKSPDETPEARALRYERQFKASYDKARDLAVQAEEKLNAFVQSAHAVSMQRSGLNSPPANADEIRTALRAMPANERQAFIGKAFDLGDTEILASIHGKHHILWGGIDGPLEPLFEQYLTKADPDRQGRMSAAEEAKRALGLAADAFTEKAKEWRDPAALECGQQQEAEFKEATEAISRALGE